MSDVRLWDPATADVAQVLMEFAGCGNDAESVELTKATTHELVLARLRIEGKHQAGPVEWRFFDPDVAGEMLAQADLANDPNTPGLLEFLAGPDVQLVVTTVAWLP